MTDGVSLEGAQTWAVECDSHDIRVTRLEKKAEDVQAVVFSNRQTGRGELLNLRGFPVSMTNLNGLGDHRNIHAVVFGENVDTEISVKGSVDSDGNKSAGVDVDVSTKDGGVSVSASGSVSKDSDGHVSSEAQGKVTINF
ncbi:MAG: hypothetical protein KDK71_07380 [Chlamydiia bacterium]|nr:hypothetical protein [Chlamydiia bacterium]